MRKYIKPVDIIVVITAIVCSMLIPMLFSQNGAQCAVIYVDGDEFGRYSLYNENRQEIEVSTEFGYNLVIIEDKKVWVSESDCKDKVEIISGSINKAGQSLICLPNRLVVTVEGSLNTDATAF